MKGYMGKLLRVDLTTGQASEEALDPKLARDHIGGAGLGLRLAYNEIPPDTDPLAPESKLFVTTGPVTATNLGTAGRYEAVFKSPLTGILCDASSGGHWGAELKRAGFDLTPDDLLVISDRINTLHRAYNYRCGIRREDDTLPVRSMMPVAEGGAANKVPDLEYQLNEYYEIRRWEHDGKPSRGSLVDLGLDDVANDLYDHPA
jgi:aldehyde:ferredoxin oxidoreductase